MIVNTQNVVSQNQKSTQKKSKSLNDIDTKRLVLPGVPRLRPR
jgi:hypothetical protein